VSRGIELYQCTTGNAVSLAAEMKNGAADSTPMYMVTFNNLLYFAADSSS
jgi:hypothetical protein